MCKVGYAHMIGNEPEYELQATGHPSRDVLCPDSGLTFFSLVLAPPTSSSLHSKKKGCTLYKRKVDTVKKNIQLKNVG